MNTTYITTAARRAALLKETENVREAYLELFRLRAAGEKQREEAMMRLCKALIAITDKARAL